MELSAPTTDNTAKFSLPLNVLKGGLYDDGCLNICLSKRQQHPDSIRIFPQVAIGSVSGQHIFFQ